MIGRYQVITTLLKSNFARQKTSRLEPSYRIIDIFVPTYVSEWCTFKKASLRKPRDKEHSLTSNFLTELQTSVSECEFKKALLSKPRGKEHSLTSNLLTELQTYTYVCFSSASSRKPRFANRRGARRSIASSPCLGF